MNKLHSISSLLVLLMVVLASCSKMEEIEPCEEGHAIEYRRAAADEVLNGNGNTGAIDSNADNRSGGDRPVDGPDGVNDDDDTEDDTEVQSVSTE